MSKNKKGIILSIIGIIGLIVITAGVTYAFFNYAKEGTTENSLTSGSITFLYTEVSGVGKGISIENMYPVSDAVGKAQTGEGGVFDFKVTSNTMNESNIPYEVTARKSTVSTLDEAAVKLYLTKVSGTSEEEVLLDNYSNLTATTKVDNTKYTEKTIYKGKVPAGSSNYEQAFRLRMWIDEDTDFSDGTMNNKTFTVTVNVYANAKVVTEEEIKLESNNEISSIQVGDKSAVLVDNSDYDYEIGLESGTTDINLKVETVSEDTSVKVEKLDSLAYSTNVKRLATTNNFSVEEGNNYFKITATALTGEKKTSIINVHVGEYKESLLNGTDPIVSDSLVPVVIATDGTVQKVDSTYKWYDYEEKIWANAVVLKDTGVSYSVGEIIPEENIESYFVWIPKYSYQLWDLGNYDSFTSIDSTKPHTIPIKFGLTNTNDLNTGECTTPMSEDGTQGLAGESGNCQVGDYMTHPAFLAFDSNGMWVGKFETGYDGATTKTEAGIDSSDSNKIIIKPDVYSWRSNSIGNMFKVSYDYLRDEDSHAMKNTEWGAVAYLSHSEYGTCEDNICSEVELNNKSNYKTGYAEATENYFNSLSNVASTSGNKSGIYDMSGGAWDFVMGYTTAALEDLKFITTVYSDFFTNDNWNKYYDKYSSGNQINFTDRILGDATGEMGPFESIYDDSSSTTRGMASWYGDSLQLPYSTGPYFERGNRQERSTLAGIFSSYFVNSDVSNLRSFRIVLAPTK